MRITLLALLAFIMTAGCVWTGYYKDVVVTKDGDGNIVSIVITERIAQPRNVADPIVFEYIHLRPVNARGGSTPVLVPQNPEPAAPPDPLR